MDSHSKINEQAAHSADFRPATSEEIAAKLEKIVEFSSQLKDSFTLEQLQEFLTEAEAAGGQNLTCGCGYTHLAFDIICACGKLNCPFRARETLWERVQRESPEQE